MVGANYPKEENDWQKIHYSGDDIDKEAKISRIIYEWTMIDKLLVNKVHTKQMIQYLIDEGHGSLLVFAGPQHFRSLLRDRLARRVRGGHA